MQSQQRITTMMSEKDVVMSDQKRYPKKNTKNLKKKI